MKQTLFPPGQRRLCRARFLLLLLLALGPACWNRAAAQVPDLPGDYPPGQYDERLVPSYVLPDPLLFEDGTPVGDTTQWRARRREIIQLFEDHVYGRPPVERPAGMTWRVASATRTDSMTVKNVVILLSGKESGPKMDLEVATPSHGPAPVFLIPWGRRNRNALLERGYGVASFNPLEVQPDHPDSLFLTGMQAAFPFPDAEQADSARWGVLGAWAWAMSRAMDFLETDPDVDASRVAVLGFSRFGKAALWAAARDRRFAAVYSVQSGLAGSGLARRGYGETMQSITGYAPQWFNARYKTYVGREEDLPLDGHLLLALIAPRPLFVNVAERDYWGDPRGSFLAAGAATPVYRLFGYGGIESGILPPTDTFAGDRLGFSMGPGGHGITAADWSLFLDFADRQFGRISPQ